MLESHTFESQLKKLNPQQRQAVTHIEGPMMVLAGPGTGKTQVVAMRIGEILRRTQLDPKNILALTFTEAGVTALRERLVKLIGVTGYRVGVYTFHGFANEVIGTFPHLFARTSELEQLNELDRFLILETLLAENSWELLRPLRAPGQFVKDFSAQIKTCKQEAVSPEQLKDLATQNYKTVETKTKESKEQAELEYKRLLQFCELYNAYESYLEQHSLYDYEDLILLVTKAFRENSEIKAFFQEKYQYLLVDEFQDTNNSQNELVEVLASFFASPNLFVVGDDKQAIMRFQGASVANMLTFVGRHHDAELVTLQENYRSTSEVLRTADELIRNNHVQLQQFLPQLSDTLIPTLPSLRKPVLVHAQSNIAQWQWVADELRSLQKKGTPWQEMAVLMRRNDQVKKFRDFAERLGIPVAGSNTTVLTNQPVIQTLIYCLKAISNPNDDRAVYSLSRLIATKKQLLLIFKTLANVSNRKLRLIERISKVTALAPLSARIFEWHQRSGLVSVDELILELLDATQIIEKTDSVRQLELLETIKAFIELSREFGRKNNSRTIDAFLRYLETMQSHNLSIEVNGIGAEETGLHVSTVHKAKGLEFEAVFMVDVDEQCYQIRAGRNIIKLPGSITGLKNWQQDIDDDERRLFYVGITRAKRHLYLTYSHIDEAGRSRLPCRFVQEMLSTLQEELPSADTKKITQLLATTLAPLSREVLTDEELSYIRSRVRNNPLSATALHTYQVCPRQYLLTQVLKLPGVSSPALEYGNAIHKALELFGRDHRIFGKLPGKENLLEHFTAEVRRSVNAQDQEPAIGKGSKVLAAFYDQVLSISPAPLHTEYSFSSHRVMIDDIWLTGKFDRIEVIDSKAKLVRVIDYKTSSTAKTRNFIEGKTKDSDGSVKQQLVFYSLLAQRSRNFPYQIGEYVIQYIDDKETFRQEVFQIGTSETSELEKVVKATHKEILERKDFAHVRDEFDRGCELCAIFPEL